MFCWSEVAKGRGFLLPFVFHDDWQSWCLVIDLWLLSKSWLFSSCIYVLLWKLGVIIPGLVGSQNNEIEFISCDWTFFGVLCLYLSTHFSQSVVITLSDSGQTLSHCSRLRFQVWKTCYNCFLTVWFNFNQWFWILSEFVCLCQLIFLCEVYYIFGLIQLIQDCTLVKQCFTKHNAVWICWCCDVDHEIGQETSVLF